MNTILESLHSRKSVRVFTDREISPKREAADSHCCHPGPHSGEPTNVHHSGYHRPAAERDSCRNLRPPAFYCQSQNGADFLRRLSKMV